MAQSTDLLLKAITQTNVEFVVVGVIDILGSVPPIQDYYLLEARAIEVEVLALRCNVIA